MMWNKILTAPLITVSESIYPYESQSAFTNESTSNLTLTQCDNQLQNPTD